MKNLEVVNDCAERGIKKLITDFKDMVNKEDQLKFFFQVGKDHRLSENRRKIAWRKKAILNGI